jgi:hypothetical protein
MNRRFKLSVILIKKLQHEVFLERTLELPMPSFIDRSKVLKTEKKSNRGVAIINIYGDEKI